MMPKIYDTKRVYSNGSESTISKIYHAEDLLEIQKFNDKKNIKSMKIKDLKWQGCNESIKLKIYDIKDLWYKEFIDLTHTYAHKENAKVMTSNISSDLIRILGRMCTEYSYTAVGLYYVTMTCT